MAGNTIEAKLRIAAEVAQAITQLRALKREIQGTNAEGAAGTGAAPTPAEAQATRAAAKARTDAAAAARQQRTEQRTAAKEAAAELAKQRAAERQANAEKVREEQEAARKLRAAANLQTQAYRGLPAQITDITTSLISGQPAYLVAIQQGGQLKDMFGGVGNAARALLSVLTPARLIVGGIAAALATVGINALQGWLQVDRFNKTMALTGSTAVASWGQLDRVTRQVAADTGASIGSVRETMEALLESGTQTSTTLAATGRAVTAYRKLTGASAEDAVKLFAGQRDAVLDWATKANKAYNFLTAAQIDHIRQLQVQGRTNEAVRFANEELAKSLESRAVPAIGLVERAWAKVKGVVSSVIDATKAVGRPETIDDQIASLEARLLAAQRLKDNMALRGQKVPEGSSPEEAALNAQLARLREQRNRDQARAAERAAAQQAEQDDIFKQSKTFTDAVANVEAAGLDKLLSQRLAALDAEKAALDEARAAELLSEQEHFLKLNRIEQQRLEAQAQTLAARLKLEEGRKEESALDPKAKQVAVAQLQAQLAGIQGQLELTQGQARARLAADAATQAQAWEKAWKDAADRIRDYQAQNKATANDRQADPLARAAEAGRLATAEQRRTLKTQEDELRLRVNLTLDPGQARALQQQLETLTREGNQVISETDRKARFDSLREQFEQLSQALQQGEQLLNDEVDRGALTTEEAEAKKLAARAGSVQQLAEIAALLRELAATSDQAEQAQVRGAESSAKAWGDLRTELGKTARSSAVSELAQGLTDVATKSKTAGEALRDMVRGFAQAMLNVLSQRLAEKLVNSMVDAMSSANAGGSGGSSGGGAWAAIATWVASLFHTGGVVGSGLAGMSRAVAPAVFAGAQVLHSGGLAGLRANEVPAILERGEEVLTADDPRHVNNYSGGGLQVSMPITLSGAGGTAEDQRAAAAALQRQVLATVQQWAADQQRQGGIFSGVRRG